jgi:ribosomal protein L30/L7E
MKSDVLALRELKLKKRNRTVTGRDDENVLELILELLPLTSGGENLCKCHFNQGRIQRWGGRGSSPPTAGNPMELPWASPTNSKKNNEGGRG